MSCFICGLEKPESKMLPVAVVGHRVCLFCSRADFAKAGPPGWSLEKEVEALVLFDRKGLKWEENRPLSSL